MAEIPARLVFIYFRRKTLSRSHFERMRRRVKLFTATVIIAALFTHMAYAQPIPGESPKEKSARESKEKRYRDVESDYKASMERIPDAPKNTDPWGTLRAPNTPSSGKK